MFYFIKLSYSDKSALKAAVSGGSSVLVELSDLVNK